MIRFQFKSQSIERIVILGALIFWLVAFTISLLLYRASRVEIARISVAEAAGTIQKGDVRRGLKGVYLSLESYLTQIDYLDISGATVVTFPARRAYEKAGWLEARASVDLGSEQDENVFGKIVIRYDLTSFLEWGALAGIISALVGGLMGRRIRKNVSKKEKEEIQNARLKAQADLAAQVAHDIRSPLSALNMAVASLSGGTTGSAITIIEGVSKRISDIADDLLKHRKNQVALEATSNFDNEEIQATTLIVDLIESLVAEKRLQYSYEKSISFLTDIKCDKTALAKVNPSDFSRVISNLINNAVEAIDSSVGNVTTAVRMNSKTIDISVVDDGPGMDSDIVSQIGEKGFSSGKSGSLISGNGLGFHHAKQVVEKARGRLLVQSRLGMGTIITVQLQRADK